MSRFEQMWGKCEKLKRKFDCGEDLTYRTTHNTIGSLLDEVIYTTQLFAFCPAAGKPQMVRQLAAPRILCNSMSIPVTRDPLPAVLLGFEFHK